MNRGDHPPSQVEVFSDTAADYAATTGRALRPVAAEVVRRAKVGHGERILDLGTGTGSAAAAAVAVGARVTGVDAAAGMLALARRDVPSAEFVEADFTALPFDDGTFDAVLAVHALNFAADPVAALAEWRRVARPGARLSISVPGPEEHMPSRLFGPILERHGIATTHRAPTDQDLAAWAAAAGWEVTLLDGDPSVEVVLPDAEAFAAWRRTGSRGAATAGWSGERVDRLGREMLEAVPRDAAGRLHIPFGALYLTALRVA